MAETVAFCDGRDWTWILRPHQVLCPYAFSEVRERKTLAGHGLVVSFLERKSDAWAGGSRNFPDWITVV